LTRIVLVLVGSEFSKILGSEISEIFWKFIAKLKIVVKLSNKFYNVDKNVENFIVFFKIFQL
jgi:hypothetical protein